MNGTVEALTPDWRGATLVTAVGSVLTVDDVADFDEEGGWLTIADAAPLEYVAIDEDADTVTLTGTAGTVEAGDPVVVWDPSVPPSGAKVVEYLASVMTDRGPVDAVLEHEKIPLAGVDTLVGASVSLTEDTYGTPYVDQILGREPLQDLSYADASTLDVTTLPPVSDGDPPSAATTVTPIGGIGSMFYRWTEVDNADPVTYRLYVRAGASPAAPTLLATNLATDPSYELTESWGPISGSTDPVRSTDRAWQGAYSVKFARGSGTSVQLGRRSSFTTMMPGAGTYRIAVRVWVDPVITGSAGIRISGTGVGALQNAYTATRSAWTEVSITFTWDGVGTAIFDVVDASITAGALIYIDGLILTAGSAVVPYFDGDTTDTASIVYAWTGTPNASTSTMSSISLDTAYEVAAGVGLTSASVRKLADGTAIVGDGSVTYHAIVAVEDADGPGPASADVTGIPAQVTGPDIATNAVTTDTLLFNDGWGINLTGETLTGATIQTRGTQDRGIKLGEVNGVESFIIYNETGVPFVKAIPTEGLAVIAGEVKANSLTVAPTSTEEGTSLGGVTEVTRHPDGTAGILRLTGYTTPPKSAPTVTTGYDTVQFTNDGKWADRHGWSTDGTYWYTVCEISDGIWRAEKWSSAGALVASSGSSIFVDGTSVYHSGKVYALYRGATVGWSVSQYDATTLAFEKSGNWSQNDGNSLAAIGVDAATGDLLIAQSRPSDATVPNRVRIRRYTMPATSGDPLVAGTSVDSSFAFAQDLSGVLYGTHDLGANRYIFANRLGGNYRVVNTTGTAVDAEDWQSGMGAKVGFAYTGGAFVSMDQAGLMRTYTAQDKTTLIGDASMAKWVSNTLASATLETTQSPRAKVIPWKRSKLNVTTSTINTGGANAPDRVKIYVGQDRSATVGTTSGSPNLSGTFTATDVGSAVVGSGIPTGTTVVSQTGTAAVMSKNATATAASVVVTLSPDRAGMWKQTDPATGVVTTSYSSLASSGTNPPSSNGFQAVVGTIQRLELADGTAFLDGVGGGSAWTTYTPTFTAITTNPTLASFTRTGRYARIGRNTIAFSIVITATAASGFGSGTYSFGLPVAARSADEVIVQARQTSPTHVYIGSGDSTTSFVLTLTATEVNANVTNTGMASGTILRITGTYEAA